MSLTRQDHQFPGLLLAKRGPGHFKENHQEEQRAGQMPQ